MTFPAGKVTARLVDGEVIFWTGEMNSGDQPEETTARPFQGRFTSKGLPLFNPNKTTSLGISLFD
jgi:hypothetical protein